MITIYHNPACGTSRNTLAMIRQSGEEPRVIEYLKTPPSRDELADLIRQHPRCRHVAIIFISAVHLTDLDRLKGYQRGAGDYVSVPINPELLRAKVSVFADLHRKTRTLETVNLELSHLSAMLLNAQDDERRRVARELHDELGQFINAIKIDAVSIRDQASAHPRIANSALAIIQSANPVHTAVIGMIRRLRPVGVDDLGLAATLSPPHTSVDGDTLFCLSTAAAGAGPRVGLDALGLAAADCVAEAVTRGIRQASALGGLPAWRDLLG